MSKIWEKFKAQEGAETVVIAGEVFEIKKSLKAKEVREIISKAGNDPQKLYRELVKTLIINPKPPANFDEIWDEMDAAIQAELIEKAIEKSGIHRLFRLAMG